jgi:GT2 family glycosyltransferase
VVDVELSAPLPEITPPEGQAAARVLARVHSYPVGQVDIALPASGLAGEDLAVALSGTLPLVRDHLHADGLAAPRELPPGGVGQNGEPNCLARRRALLADPPLISVLIATHDRTQSLLRCLRSLAALRYPRFEVIVADNAPSTAATAEAVAALGGRLGSAPVRYVRECRPGKVLALNRGLAEARGSWLAMVDDDVAVDPHWLTGILEATSSASGVGCVTGPTMAAAVSTPAERLRERGGGYPQGFTWRAWNLVTCRPRGDALFPYTTGRLGAGANIAFDVAALDAVGGFDQALGPGTPARGGEDLLALLQVLTAGYTVAYGPAALVWHWHRRGYPDLRRQVHDSGVGLGAYLTSAVVHEPRLLPGMLGKVIPAGRHLLGPSSPRNRTKGTGYPRELEVAELLGLLQGPFRYGQSRLEGRRARR